MRKLRDEQKGAIFLVLIFAIIVVVTVFFAVSLKTDTVNDILKEEKLARVLLLVEDEDNKALFSTVIIYDPNTHKAASYNLPGYTGTIFQSLGRTDSLDNVYNEKGIEVYKQEVERLLGIKIPFTVKVSMNNFIRVTDMLGGMRVFISSPIDELADDGERHLLPSGAVNLDGDKISIYLKYRLQDEDESELLDRYQNVTIALLSGLHENNFIIFKDQNFKKYSSCFDSNLSDDDEETLFKTLSELDPESIIRQTITGTIRVVEGRNLLLPLNNGEFIKTAVQQTTNMLTGTDGNVAGHVFVLRILNGTSTQGLAGKTRKLYQDSSYNVLPADNANTDYEQTVVIDHIGNEVAAKNVGQLIRCTNVKNIEEIDDYDFLDSEASVDFTVILGSDFNGEVVIKK